MNKSKRLADLVRQEREAIQALDAHQDATYAREVADSEKNAELSARIDVIQQAKEELLDDLNDDDFESVTVE